MAEHGSKVVHLTSVHPRYDARIFLKECRSLANAGYDVSLVVADGQPDEERDGVKIYGVDKASSRIERIRKVTGHVYRKALALDAEIYHLHDPELMPIGLKLKNKGKKVIFDAHEDLPLQLLNKHYYKKWILKILSKLAALYEFHACRQFDAIVAATPTIRRKFDDINSHSVDVNNYPVLEEVITGERRFDGLRSFCYVGGIGKARGIFEVLRALDYCSQELNLSLAGGFSSKDVDLEVRALPQWKRVDFKGFVARDDVAKIYQSSFAGLVTLHPIPNYLDALPVKMFEYMGAGLPVIASNIPLWVDIILEEQCGLCVDPLNPRAIADAIMYLYKHPDKAQEMGKNGQKAVLQKYNWSREEDKLISLYGNL